MALFNYRRFRDCAAEIESPPVYVVDTHASRPPLPPRLNHKPRRSGRTQTLWFLLVGLALCGVLVEAGVIYHLHLPGAAPSPVSSMHARDKAASKPVAHLTGSRAVAHDEHVLAWNMKAEPLLNGIGYRDGSLVIERDGYYYVYSKVFFTDSGLFHHYVKMRTRRFEVPLTLLQSRKYSPRSVGTKSNSFLGGVFYFERSDSVYVNVSNITKLEMHRDEENVFGAFMI